MSYFNSDIKFTPIHPRHNNDLFIEKNISGYPNFNNNLNNNLFNFNQQNQNLYQKDNNYFQNSPFGFNKNIIENNNLYNSCYILITKFDNYTKQSLNDFIYQQGISPRDIKYVRYDTIIIKFQNQRNRNEFINAFSKVKDNFYGVEIRFIDENEKDKIINNNANIINRNISYNNDYMNKNYNMIQLPQNKSNFQKFLDVFLNL